MKLKLALLGVMLVLSACSEKNKEANTVEKNVYEQKAEELCKSHGGEPQYNGAVLTNKTAVCKDGTTVTL